MSKQAKLTDLDTQGQDLEEVRGTLDRVFFRNEENGYTVFRFQVEDKDEITVVGYMSAPQPGSSLVIKGNWTKHPRFGRQFIMESFEESRPATTEGIRMFLSSGCVKGIGPRWAERIVQKFGMDTLQVLDEHPQRLLEIPRFGTKRLEMVLTSWSEHQGMRELMIYIQPLGLGAAYAMRIFRAYGQAALMIVKENPYRLAMDIQGIGFIMADALASRMGIPQDSPLRAEAGLLYTLMKQNDEGHIFYPKGPLLELASQQLNIEISLLEDALVVLAREERIIIDDLRRPDGTFEAEPGIYLSRQHLYEEKIAFYLKRLLNSPKSIHFSDAKNLVNKVLANLPIELADEQKEAVHCATTGKVMVLTGGPGTGKTTLLNAIIQVYQEVRAKILLAAPTGRAAKRMADACNIEAKTIHRLLEYSPKDDGFARNENNPLACGLLVVDEASMVDTMLMYHLVKAAPLGATFLLVGDINQLPSVGPGNVLRDLIASGSVQVVELYEVFRQAAQSDIIINAHLINKGMMPSLRNKDTDFYFFKESEPEKVADLVVDLVQNRIPKRFGFNGREDVQVLSPMLKGSAGVANLNIKLQAAMNPQTVMVQRGERQYRLGDKVMQIRNNYDKDIFNGDMGMIFFVDEDSRDLVVRFDERNINYSFEELDEIVPAYAISIHKSQGGEYPVVVVPLLMQHFVLLQRNLVYTAVTRGKKLVVLVGETKALAMAINNNRIRHRYTWLAARLATSMAGVRMDMLPGSITQNHDETPIYDDIPEDW